MGCCLIDHDLMKILLRIFTSDIFTNNKMMITLGFSVSESCPLYLSKNNNKNKSLCTISVSFNDFLDLFSTLCRFYFDIVSVILLLSDWQHIRLGRRSSLPKTTRKTPRLWGITSLKRALLVLRGRMGRKWASLVLR
jgi:hypothetical protein